MSRYGGVITGDVRAGAGVGYTDMDAPTYDQGADVGPGFGPGTTARRALIMWGVATGWLVLAWYAARSY